MKIKYVACCLCAFVITGCSSKENEVSLSTTQENPTSSISTVMIDESTPSDAPEKERTEDAFMELYGVKFYYPSSFEEDMVSGQPGLSVYSGPLKTGDTGYFFIAEDPFYESEFTETSVPDILDTLCMKLVDSKFSTFDSKYSISTDSEVPITVSGYPFIKRVGNIHTESDVQTSELKYCAYYGKLDFPKYESNNVPIMWMTFSNSDSDDTLSEMEAIVDHTANSLSWE